MQRPADHDYWQQKCLDLGFEYWRAPDAHGVKCTYFQAINLLQELLGVEVEIAEKPKGILDCLIESAPLYSKTKPGEEQRGSVNTIS